MNQPAIIVTEKCNMCHFAKRSRVLCCYAFARAGIVAHVCHVPLLFVYKYIIFYVIFIYVYVFGMVYVGLSLRSSARHYVFLHALIFVFRRGFLFRIPKARTGMEDVMVLLPNMIYLTTYLHIYISNEAFSGGCPSDLDRVVVYESGCMRACMCVTCICTSIHLVL